MPLAQSSELPRLPEAIATVAHLLRVAFPDWEGVGRRYEFRTGFVQAVREDPLVSSVTVEALEGTRSIPVPEDPKHLDTYLEDVFLLLTVDFDPRGQIRDARFSGRGVREREGNQLRRLVDAHPEWSDAQVVDAVNAAGARYGPEQREAFLRRFRELDLESILGQTSLDRVDFLLRNVGDLKVHQPAAELQWVVYLKAPDGVFVALDFEPFEGRLTNMLRFSARVPRQP